MNIHNFGNTTENRMGRWAVIHTTTLADETCQFQALLASRMQSYQDKPPRGETVAERIFAILQSHTEHRVAIGDAERRRILGKIEAMVALERPILMAMTFAIGTRMPNRLKFHESVNLPHLGWMHLFWYFALVHEKVKRVYAPGIKLVIFDEATLLGHHVGTSGASIAECISATRHIATAMDAPVDIQIMRPEDFPKAEVATMTNGGVTDGRIFSLLCCMPEMQDPAIMEGLYLSRKDRDLNRLRELAGPLWDRARAVAEIFDCHFTYRKRAELFPRWLETELYLDVTVTDKDERLVFDVTETLINHGIPVVDRSAAGKYRLRIMPEYRVNHGAVPVRIKSNEVLPGGSADEFTFYYLVQNGAH